MDQQFYDKLKERLKPNDYADLETLFYAGRDGLLAELYEEELAKKRTLYSKAKDPCSDAMHVLKKTNFARHFSRGIRNMGRDDLADTLDRLISKS